MATYCIEYHEHSVCWVYVEADSEKEALEEFEHEAQEGLLENEFAKMEVEETSAVATLVEEGGDDDA